MKVRDVIKRVEQDGWVLDRTEGSHRQYRHPSKPGQVTIAGHPSEEMHPKTLKSILRQAGMEGRL
jgi:predicted RNA binding protein YcfA (HicA-like mRNA interferase family)